MALATLLVTLVFPSYAWDLDKTNRIIDEAVYALLGVGFGGDYQPQCTGSLVDLDHRLILTAQHCTAMADENGVILLERKQRDGFITNVVIRYRAKIVAQDKKHDLALLQIQTKGIDSHFAATIQGEDGVIRRGEFVWTAGMPAGRDVTLSTGIISRLGYGPMGRVDEYAWIQFQLPCYYGCSGAPIFNENGEIIAVLTAGLIIGRGISVADMAFGRPASLVRDLLGEYYTQHDLSPDNK